jgi:hypothetical protein
MKRWRDGVVESWSVGSLRIGASLQYWSTPIFRFTSCLILCALLFAFCASVDAQQAKKIPRIGYLSNNDPATESTRAEVFQAGLREVSYVQGQNIAIEYRYAERKSDRLRELAAELVRLKIDIIVVAGGDRADPGGQECDPDHSHRNDGSRGRSCRGRSN